MLHFLLRTEMHSWKQINSTSTFYQCKTGKVIFSFELSYRFAQGAWRRDERRQKKKKKSKLWVPGENIFLFEKLLPRPHLSRWLYKCEVLSKVFLMYNHASGKKAVRFQYLTAWSKYLLRNKLSEFLDRIHFWVCLYFWDLVCFLRITSANWKKIYFSLLERIFREKYIRNFESQFQI